MTTLSEVRPGHPTRRWLPDGIPRWVQYTVGVYLLSRLLYFGVASADSLIQHWRLQTEMSNWDGFWYLSTAQQGYPHVIPTGYHAYSTLGFLPLYPMLMWTLSRVPLISPFGAGLIIAMSCGLITTLNMSRLAARWWDEQASRRAVMFFCFFPGSVVFSMAYSEGLGLMLVSMSLLALEDRRWVRAGIAAGLSTAIAPVMFAIIPATVVAALRELHRRGWTSREGIRSLLAPALSPIGAIGFAIFLWAWVGTPFASYIAQHDAWGESSTPLAVPNLAVRLFKEIFLVSHYGSHGPGGIDLNAIGGLIGALLLIFSLYLFWRDRRRIPLPAMVYTLGIIVLVASSKNTPPNARMLICAFPAMLAIGAHTKGRLRWWVLGLEIVLLIVMTYFTYVGNWLRP